MSKKGPGDIQGIPSEEIEPFSEMAFMDLTGMPRLGVDTDEDIAELGGVFTSGGPDGLAVIEPEPVNGSVRFEKGRIVIGNLSVRYWEGVVIVALVGCILVVLFS